MHKIKVNGKYDFDIDNGNGALSINNSKVNADVRVLNAVSSHIINESKSYNTEVISFDPLEKTASIKVNNNIYTLTAKDQFDILLDKLGLSNMAGTKVSEVKAPMPGLVLKVMVTEGSEIKKGDNLFILEAMKMENIIKAPADVTVKTVKIKPGDKVEKGQILLLFN
jgi:biotin carboxyl carrier protein